MTVNRDPHTVSVTQLVRIVESFCLEIIQEISTMGLSADASANLRTVILSFIGHTLANAVLLSPLNPMRCFYWNQSECSSDQDWICNWLAFAHLHVSILLTCMIIKAESDGIERVGYLCCAIIMCYIMEGIFSIDLLDPVLSVIQCVIYVGILSAIAYFTYEDPKSINNLLARPVLKKMKSSSSFDQRQKLPIATIAIMMHLLSSFFRVVDMTFGKGHEGYTGDMSSPIYQSISNFAVCDMMLTCFLLAFALRFCTTEQHKLILWGQAVILFVSQAMLASSQGEQMEGDMALAGSIGTFVFILIAILGAL